RAAGGGGRLVARGPGAFQDHVLAGLELAPVEEAAGPGDEEEVAAADRAIEEGLAGPGALDHPGLVAEDGLEDAEAGAGGDDALAYDGADDGDLLVPDADGADRVDVARVDVAARHEEGEVARGAYAHP